MCILFVHTLLKVVGYYDLSVLSMSVMVFPKTKVCIECEVSSIQFYSGFVNFLNFAKPLGTPVDQPWYTGQPVGQWKDLNGDDEEVVMRGESPKTLEYEFLRNWT